MHPFNELPKFIAGQAARLKWAKKLDPNKFYSIENFNQQIGNNFHLVAEIILNDDNKQKVIKALPINPVQWKEKGEFIYCIVYNDNIVKIGGTRTSMKDRFSSYLCGHYVPERKASSGKNCSGKMSATNAYVYQTIEETLLKNEGKWKIWSWRLPRTMVTVDILDTPTEVIAQTYHAYETVTINKFKEFAGHTPQLSDNCDPNYRKKK